MRMLLWVAGALMLVAAAMLIAEVGATALWIAVITIGIAVVVTRTVAARLGDPRAGPARSRACHRRRGARLLAGPLTKVWPKTKQQRRRGRRRDASHAESPRAAALRPAPP